MGINRRTFLKSCAAVATLNYLPSFMSQATSLDPNLFGILPAAENIQRVISAGPPSDLLLYALAPEKLAGFASISLNKYGSTLFSPQWRQLPVYGRLAGRGSTLSLEKLLDLNPDLIVDTGNIDETYRSQAKKVSEQTGLPYLLIPGGLKDSASQLKQLGKILNVPEQAHKLVSLTEDYLASAEKFAKSQTRAPRFYLARGAKGLQTGAAGSIHTEAIEMLGFQNVVSIPGFNGLTEISMEQLYEWDPDIIITQYEEANELMLTHPVWQQLSAIKNKQLFCFSGMPFGWLDGPPGINRLLGMRRLQSHFEQTEASSIRQDIQLFFTHFYHSPLTEAQIDWLMERS
nr:iron ABC transporter substrate-binding protein [uncultured Moellerella sp.]